MFNIFKTKVKTNKNQRKWFKIYMSVNNDIMQIINDIEDMKTSLSVKVDSKIEALQVKKSELEKQLIDIEEYFYDEQKGLWIGTAYDLKDPKYEPFLLYLPWKNLYNHFEVYGTSGYGKSRLLALMVRQMIKFGWSTMVVDPKGGEKQEIPQWLYDFAAEAGRNEQVMRIMPSYPEISDKHNIIFGWGNDEIASTVSSLTTAGNGPQSSDEQFFSGQAYKIILTVLNATTYLERVAYSKREINNQIKEEVQKYIDFKEHRNLNHQYFTEQEYENDVDVSKIALTEVIESSNQTLISPFTRTLITFRELSYYSNYDRLVELKKLVQDYPIPTRIKDKQELSEIQELKRTAIMSLEETTSKEKAFFEKTGDSLSVILSQLAYGPIGKIMCDIRINPMMQKIRDKEGVIVIIQPAPMRFERVSEMVIKCYVKMFTSLFGTIGATGRGLHKRTAFIIDEAKPMIFPGIEELFNKARQLGMTVGCFYQSKFDLIEKVGPNLASIIQDNCATSITMKQMSFKSCEEVASSLGTTKIAVNINMREQEGGGGRSTVNYEDRDLAQASDIDALGIGEGIIRHYGKQYYTVFPYQRDPMPINVVMPELKQEELMKDISKIESRLKIQSDMIDSYNFEYSTILKDV